MSNDGDDRVLKLFKGFLATVEDGEEVTDVITALGMAMTLYLEMLPERSRQQFALDACRTMMHSLGCLDEGPRVH